MSDHDTRMLEEALIGALLNDSLQYYAISAGLKPDCFSDPLLGEVYGVIAALLEQGKGLDVNLVCHGIKTPPKGFSLSAALLRFAKDTGGGSFVEDYAGEIIEGHRLRRLDAAAAKIATMSKTGERAEELAEEAHKAIDGVLSGTIVRETETAGHVGKRLLERISESHQEHAPHFTINTGLGFLDELLGPLIPGQLIWIGGRSGMGKSILSGQITTSVARQGIAVCPVLTEMSPDDAESRALQAATAIPSESIQALRLNAEEEERLAQAVYGRDGLPIHYDGGGFDPFDRIRARLKRLTRLQGIRLAIIDHFHDMTPIDPRKSDAEQKNELAKKLKELAKELQIPIIVFAQARRWEPMGGVIKAYKDIPWPNIQMFQGSAGIEQSADKMVVIHRPEWFLEQFKPASPGEEWENAMFSWKNRTLLVIPKSRNSQGNRQVSCFFNGPLQRFQYEDPRDEALI